MKMFRRAFVMAYVNDTDAFVPEIWANEGISILEENIVAAGLVFRDFEDEIKNEGDTVHTRKPSEFEAVRKDKSDDVTIQDAIAVDIPVVLNQHVHTSFTIPDSDLSKSFKDLVREFLKPAVLSMARYADKMVLFQYAQFLFANSRKGYLGGSLQSMTANNGIDYILDTRNVMNINKADTGDRVMILTPDSETALLKIAAFTQAQSVGDAGTAMRKASLGEKFAFNMFMCQNMASVPTGNTVTLGAINNGAGYAAGTATVVVDTFTGAVVTGAYLTIAGDMTPYRVSAHSETLSATTGITLDPPLRRAVVNDAVVTVYTPGAVDQSVSPTGYAAGYGKTIVVDGFTVAPKVGQMVSFGTTMTDPVYVVMSATTTGIKLDRPLDAAIADNAVVCIGPAGNYNLAFNKNAIALVVRPLAPTPAGMGARSAVINDKDLSMRVTFQYQGKSQGLLVTTDFLAGIKVLEPLEGAVMLG